MNGAVEELFMPVGPITGRCFAIPVTSSSVHIDLTGGNYAALLPFINAGAGIVEVTGDADVFYRWSAATSGETVDETVTGASGTQANITPRLFVGERKVERPGLAVAKGQTVQGIVVKSTAATTILRITVCSKSRVERMWLG